MTITCSVQHIHVHWYVVNRETCINGHILNFYGSDYHCPTLPCGGIFCLTSVNIFLWNNLLYYTCTRQVHRILVDWQHVSGSPTMPECTRNSFIISLLFFSYSYNYHLFFKTLCFSLPLVPSLWLAHCNNRAHEQKSFNCYPCSEVECYEAALSLVCIINCFVKKKYIMFMENL